MVPFRRLLMRRRIAGLALLIGWTLAAATLALADDKCPATATPSGSAGKQPAIRIGAVAYAPSSVTVFEGLRRYLGRQGLSVDYTLYSNYDALVDALAKKQV